jgi:chaperonin GroES
MRIRPLYDRVVVKRNNHKEEKIGAIYLPEHSQERPQEGEVAAIGTGTRIKGVLIPPDLKPGDRVLFGKYTGTDIKIAGCEYVILRENEVLAVVEQP